MKKLELYKKIVKELEESKASHICCFIDDKAIMSSIHCSDNDLYNFLFACCKNIPWAKDVIKDFANEIDGIEKNDTKQKDDTFLN